MENEKATVTATKAAPVKDNFDTAQIFLGLLCVAAVIVAVVGIFMAFIPASSSTPSYFTDAADLAREAVREAARQARGQFLATLSAIVAVGTGIILVLRARLTRQG